MFRTPLRAVVVAGAMALTLAACGGSGADQTIEPSPTDTTPARVTESAAGSPVPDAGADCSAGDLAVAAVQPQGLTDAAAETWNALRSNAMACDYEALAELAGEDFSFSFGADDDPASHWRDAEASGEPVMADLVQVLGLPAGEDDDGNSVWPRVHVDPEDDTAWDEVAGIYPPEVIAEWREGGSGYLGYRTAIASDGTWLYFIAGD